MNQAIIFIILLFCLSCDQKRPNDWQTISGRDSPQERLIIRHPIYRARIPKSWKRVDPSPETSIVDTTLPIIEFWIEDQIRITLHNFPADRIPPMAQITRWKSQLKELPPKEALVEPVSRAGYAGFYFEGRTKEKLVMGWALQLDHEHYRALSKHVNESNRGFIQQMKADVTIKVVGPPDLSDQHRGEITVFANSFELIQEIPRSS